MFIISWNVAGWSTTSKNIREDFGSIAAFLNSTKADIVSLQEVKGTWSKLDSNAHDMGASDSGLPAIDGWESFWSFSSKAHRGFNGVATFARKGLTWGCDSRPFGNDNEDLNDEGRAVVTYHSACVIVNTYVVNARHGLRAAFKMRFLENLKSLLLRLKEETGKPVILLGDLNQTCRPEDAYWSFRRIDLSVMQQMICRAEDSSDVEWAESFPFLLKSTLKRLEEFVVEQTALTLISCDDPVSTTGTGSGRSNNGALQGNAPKSISVDAGTLDEDVMKGDPAIELIQQIGERHRQRRRQKDETLSLTSITELCEAGIINVSVDPLTRQSPPSHNRDLFALVQYCGVPPHADASVQFMRDEFLTELGLCDSLLHGRDAAATCFCPCPYTCWDQSRNKRFTNEGTRIDYILIDSALASHLVPCSATPNNIIQVTSAPSLPDASRTKELSFFSEFNGEGAVAGVRRATGGGSYAAASFDGSGLPKLMPAARDLQFRGLPSTGLFVTPPNYSDHCGVCALFAGIELLPRTGKVEERHRCMYRPPMSLQSFFSKRPRNEATSTTEKAVETSSILRRKNEGVSAVETAVIDVDNDGA